MATPSVVETILIAGGNIPVSNDTKIVSEFQRFGGEVAFTNFVIQTKTKNIELFFARWRLAISEPHQTWHGDMAIWRYGVARTIAPPKHVPSDT